MSDLATSGNVVDHDVIRDEVYGLCKKHRVTDLAYDPWSATNLAQQLLKQGIKVVEFRQTYKNFNEPCKLLEQMIASRELAHDGNPIATWCAGNATLKVDTYDHCMPIKETPSGRIDGLVALLMAMGRSMVNHQKVSPYADRGIMTL